MLKVEVIYEPGKKNVLADALSRLKSSNSIVSTILSEIKSIDEGNLLNPIKSKIYYNK